ncbi:MAG: DNA repair protein RadC [Bacilli bacterium]|nr:DNA repair protein RadC [Bacilli bacterium]MDD4608075.1 DNA repair protein RadC [Bacilli bacterium]
MTIKIKDLPIEDRPRERLISKGAENLSNEELISILIRTGYKNESAKNVATKLLSKYGNINNFKELNYNDLIKIKGIGKSKACDLIAAVELGKRINKEITSLNNLKMNNSTIIYNYYHDLLNSKKQECFYCVYLDTNKRIIKDKLLFMGTLNQSLVHPREIFKEAYLVSASAIVCVHNHPSGNVLPSLDDINLTKALVEVGKVLGVEVIDHIIIGKHNYYSFFENNDI